MTVSPILLLVEAPLLIRSIILREVKVKREGCGPEI